MNQEKLEGKTVSGFIFKFAESAGAKGFNFIISIVLARMLLPEEFGIISLVTIFITICDVFVTYGFGNSLIVDKKSDNLDFSTCFYFGIVFSLAVYVIIWFAAPFISAYYGYPILISIIRVMGIRVPISAINSVQQAYVSKNMMFRKFFYATLIGTIVSGIIAIVMAQCGFGVWALVEQYLGNVCIDTVCLWIIVGWRPNLAFSFKRLKKIYSYGWKILVTGLIDTGYNQLRSLVIAKKYTSSDLAYYNKGTSFPTFGIDIIEPTIAGVIFPALSHCNDNKMQMKSILRKVVKASTYIIFPIMFGLLATSKSLVRVILTSRWDSCVIFLQIGCLAFMFRPIQVINNCVVQASKRSDLLLKLNIIKKGIGIVLLLISMNYGVEAIAISLVITNVVATIINIFPNRKIVGYGYLEQLRDIGLNFFISFVMGGIVYAENLLQISDLLLLIIQVFTGVIVYIAISIVFKIDGYLGLKNIVMNKIMKREGK